MTATTIARQDGRTAPSRLLWKIVDARGDLRWLGLTRLLFGVIVILHFRPAVTATSTPLDRYNEPWWRWVPMPSEGVYRTLLWVGVAAGVAMILGVVSRLATAAALSTVTYLLVSDVNAFHHNRAFLVWMLFGLALAKTGESWSLRSLRRRWTGGEVSTVGFTWPVTVMRLIASTVYLTSGTTKLIDPDWAGGRILWDRVNRHQHEIPTMFDGWVHDLVTDRWFYVVFAPAAIGTELFIGMGLWFAASRRAAVIVAVVFHLSIGIVARVQTFSYSGIAALTIWLVPLGIGHVRWSRPAPEPTSGERSTTTTERVLITDGREGRNPGRRNV